MNKERLTAFTDAVLAIIMTILVLELEEPKVVTWAHLWDLRMNFFAYAISFFWLGLTWADNHRAFHEIDKISDGTVAWTLIMLFFASLFPYSTSIVAGDFNNSTAQVFYELSLTIFPPATMYSIFIASAMLIIVSSIHARKFNL